MTRPCVEIGGIAGALTPFRKIMSQKHVHSQIDLSRHMLVLSDRRRSIASLC